MKATAIRTVVVCILMLGLVGRSPAQGYRFARTIGPSAEYGLDSPRHIAVGRGGCLYVADTANHRVLKFANDGTFLCQWGSYGTNPGQFKNPWGIAADSSGNVYVTEAVGTRVQKFSASGLYLAQWGSSGSGDGQFLSTRGVACDSAGNVYVVDCGNHRIEKFNSSGAFLGWWGKGSTTGWHNPGSGQTPVSGSGNGEMNSPTGIAIDASNNVYVTDTRNRRVQKFNTSGTYLSKWGSWGSGNGQFSEPAGIAVDSTGGIYVADQGNNRIQAFTGSTYRTKWGSAGSGSGQFSEVEGIAVDSSGKVYVTDTDSGIIQKFDTNGGFLASWGGPISFEQRYDAPGGVAVDSSGNIFVLDTENCVVRKYGPTGSYLAIWGSPGTGSSQFASPAGITVDPSGNVYVADTGNKRIQKFSNSGSFLGSCAPAQLHRPTGIAVASDGTMYVADTSTATTDLGNGSWSWTYTQQIVKLTSLGGYQTSWEVSSGEGSDLPIGIAWAPDGSIYATDPANHVVIRFRGTNGGELARWGSSGTGDGQFQRPSGVAVDAQGNVFVADTKNNRVQEFTATGAFVAKWGARASADGLFIEPRGIAVTADGSVLVASAGRVQQFEPCLVMSPQRQISIGAECRAGVSSLGGKAVVGDENGNLTCIDVAAGQVAWTFATRDNGAGSTAAIRCRPAVYGAAGAERIYFSTNDGHLFCVLGSNGSLVWHQAAHVAPDSTPAVVGNIVYVGGYSGVLSFLAANGTPVASSPAIGGPIRSSPSIPASELVWVGCESGRIDCLNANLDTVRAQIGSDVNPVIAPPMVDYLTGRLFIGSTGRTVTCLDAAHFGTLWPVPAPVDGAVSTGAWGASGEIYFTTSLGTLYCFSTTSYVPLWSYAAAGTIKSSPVAWNGWVYFGTENGFVYAVNTAMPSTSVVYSSPGQSFTTSPAICTWNGGSALVVARSDGTVLSFSLL